MRDAEASASSDASASCYGCSEDVRFFRLLKRHENSFKIQRQILLAHIVVGADNPSLQQQPEGFDIVRVNLTAHVLAAAMIHGLMAHAATEIVVVLIFIGRDQRHFIADDLADEAATRPRVRFADNLADDVAFALDSPNHSNLAVADASPIGCGPATLRSCALFLFQ